MILWKNFLIKSYLGCYAEMADFLWTLKRLHKISWIADAQNHFELALYGSTKLLGFGANY